jgi:C_GCAxxG_C_C family probable redox protein
MDAKERAEVAQKAFDLASKYDAEFGYCPQCVLAALKEVADLGITDDVIKGSFTLSGGGGLKGIGSCGALAGGLIAIGCKYGRTRDQFGKKVSNRAMLLSKQLIEKFTAEYGGISCNDVQTKFACRTFNMWDQADMDAFRQTSCKKEECPKVAGNVAKWVMEII